MIIYTILPIRREETGHFVIDDPNKPAHKEILSSTPIYIVIEKNPGTFFLNYYDENGMWLGDSWHPSIEQAKQQAEYSHKAPITNWKEIPEDIEEPIEYVMNLLKKK